jgi:hypothetical protein
VGNVSDALAADARFEALFSFFCTRAAVPNTALRGHGVVHASLDEALRAASQLIAAAGDGRVSAARARALVPADAATALVLRFGLAESPSFCWLVERLADDSCGEETAPCTP